MKKYYRDALFDLSTSVNKDVAISLMLGLRSVDPVRPDHYPERDPHAEHQIYLDGLDMSIFEIISDLRDSAQMGVDDAIEEKDPIKKAAFKNEVIRCDDLMRKAHRYLVDINYELTKGDKSILKLDRTGKSESDEQYIELGSLHEWVKEHYEETLALILPYQSAIFANTSQNADHTVDDSDSEEEKHPLLLNNLYISFAFLVEAFSKSAPAYHDDDGPTVIAIAKRLEALAKEANGKRGFLPGQKHSAIKKKIDEAMKRKKAKLAGK
jgi:hypothetical protein